MKFKIDDFPWGKSKPFRIDPVVACDECRRRNALTYEAIRRGAIVIAHTIAMCPVCNQVYQRPTKWGGNTEIGLPLSDS